MAYSKKEIESFKEEIVDKVSNGRSLKATLDIGNELPSRPTVYTWLNSEHKDYDKAFFNNYTRACEERAEAIFDEIIEIADDSTGDIKTTEDGIKTFNPEFTARSKIKIDARKWSLSKMKPKKYGDRTTTDLNLNVEQPLFPDID